jgi:hypothetical protein
MKFDFRRCLLVLIGLLVYWLVASGALWKLYDIGPLISGGHFSHSEAILMVAEMGLLVTLLTTIAWVWSSRAIKKRTVFATWWSAASRTFMILLLYWLVVFLRRQLWTPNQGVNDDAMFLPLVGHINAVFFAEFGWLLFLIGIIPCMGIVSGVVFSLEQRLVRRVHN